MIRVLPESHVDVSLERLSSVEYVRIYKLNINLVAYSGIFKEKRLN